MVAMPSTSAPAFAAAPDARLRRATRAVYATFILNGAAFASWASRIPQFRDDLGVTTAQLGLVLLSAAVGSLTALPLSGLLVDRLGARRTIVVMSLVVAAGLTVAGIGAQVAAAMVALGLLVIGFGVAMWDVSMNIEGAQVEKLLGRAIMPRFHAGFSVGTVAGALVGVATVAGHVGIAPHLICTALVVAVAAPLSVRGFLPVAPRPHEQAGPTARRRQLTAWTEPRTILIGVLVLCFAFGEGTGNDWLNVALIDGYHAPAAVGSLAFAVFVTAMTAGRWFGPALLDRYGRVPVLRLTAGLALVGLVLVVFSGVTALAVAGAVAWGAGVSLGFPVGMSAAADDPAAAAARVSTVASIGYTAFLAGPPLIGFLGDHVGVRDALLLTAGVLTLSIVVAGSCAPLVRRSHRATHEPTA